MDTYQRPLQKRGAVAWIFCAALVAFYLLIYYTYAFEGPARRLGLGDKWTLYGVLYTLAMVAGGIYFLRRHGNSRYQRIRTITVVAVQVVLAFALPIVMRSEEHTSELQSRVDLVCRLLLEKKNTLELVHEQHALQ